MDEEVLLDYHDEVLHFGTHIQLTLDGEMYRLRIGRRFVEFFHGEVLDRGEEYGRCVLNCEDCQREKEETAPEMDETA